MVLCRARQRAGIAALVVPMHRRVRQPRLAGRLAPDCQHVFGRGRREFIVKTREVVDPLDRLTDCRIEEQQNPVEHRGRHAERTGGDHERLAGRIARDALGQRPADAEHAFEHAGKFAGVALQGRVFQAADYFGRGQCQACGRFGLDVEIAQNQAAFVGACGKEYLQQIGADGRLRHGPCGCRRDRPRGGNAKPAKDRRRCGGVGRQLVGDDGERSRVDGVDQPARELDELGFFLGVMGRFLHVEVGDHAQ